MTSKSKDVYSTGVQGRLQYADGDNKTGRKTRSHYIYNGKQIISHCTDSMKGRCVEIPGVSYVEHVTCMWQSPVYIET